MKPPRSFHHPNGAQILAARRNRTDTHPAATNQGTVGKGRERERSEQFSSSKMNVEYSPETKAAVAAAMLAARNYAEQENLSRCRSARRW